MLTLSKFWNKSKISKTIKLKTISKNHKKSYAKRSKTTRKSFRKSLRFHLFKLLMTFILTKLRLKSTKRNEKTSNKNMWVKPKSPEPTALSAWSLYKRTKSSWSWMQSTRETFQSQSTPKDKPQSIFSKKKTKTNSIKFQLPKQQT